METCNDPYEKLCLKVILNSPLATPVDRYKWKITRFATLFVHGLRYCSIGVLLQIYLHKIMRVAFRRFI